MCKRCGKKKTGTKPIKSESLTILLILLWILSQTEYCRKSLKSKESKERREKKQVIIKYLLRSIIPKYIKLLQIQKKVRKVSFKMFSFLYKIFIASHFRKSTIKRLQL